MNERIKELVKQSDLFAEVQGMLWNNHERHHDMTPHLEKFAKLIILEMCNVVDKAQWDKGQDWVCADGTRIIPQIKQHFGVEE